MNLDQKLAQLKQAARKTAGESELERQLEFLQRVGSRGHHDGRGESRPSLPAQRVPKGIEAYVEGRVQENARGEYFLARQALPFGRPYGKLRIGDISTQDLETLNMFLPGSNLPPASRLVFLDTETTGLAGGTGTCAFLIGVGAVDGTEFVVRQLFLRDYPEEGAMLAALAEALEAFEGIVTFNGKTFDIPLLETRFALARMKSPFPRLLHLDLLHPGRRLWKLRLTSCKLGNLESEVLGVHRQGDVDGSEIPGIYFDYLRTGDARGLQPVFYHNALDIVSLAGLTVEMADIIGNHNQSQPIRNEPKGRNGKPIPGVDLFSLSRIFERTGAREASLSTCVQALEAGLPQTIETQALWHLASQHKRLGEYDRAVQLWVEVSLREESLAIQAFEELAMHYEHRVRDARTALDYTQRAMGRLAAANAGVHHVRLTCRLKRLEKKIAEGQTEVARNRSGNPGSRRRGEQLTQKSFV